MSLKVLDKVVRKYFEEIFPDHRNDSQSLKWIFFKSTDVVPGKIIALKCANVLLF
jgi:hypothetical protein